MAKVYESEICSVVSNSLRPHGLYSPWNSPEYWSGSIPSPADLPNPGSEPGSSALQVHSLPTELIREAQKVYEKILIITNLQGNANQNHNIVLPIVKKKKR